MAVSLCLLAWILGFNMDVNPFVVVRELVFLLDCFRCSANDNCYGFCYWYFSYAYVFCSCVCLYLCWVANFVVLIPALVVASKG